MADNGNISSSELIQIARNGHGPILAGTYLNLILFGVCIMQVYYYYQSYRSDRRWIQALIFVLFMLDTLNSIFNMVYAYTSLINHFGELSALTNANWLFASSQWFTGLIGAIVQCFFGWRVYILTRNRWATALVFTLATVEGLAGIGTGVAVVKVKAFAEFDRFEAIVVVWLAGSALCDMTVTVMLVWYLRQHKTGYKSDDVVDRIIRMTVQTGAISTVCAIIDMVLFVTLPTEGYHLAFNTILCKLYTNSLLSSLNSRRGWAFSSGSHPTDSTVNRPSIGTSIIAGRSHKRLDEIQLSQMQSTPTQVFITTDIHAVTDEPSDTFDDQPQPKPAGLCSTDEQHGTRSEC